MSGADDKATTAETTLAALYALQNHAMKTGNLATQKALEDDIDDLTYKLTQLNAGIVNADEAVLAALNVQLGKVTESAKQALQSIDKVGTVLGDMVTAVTIIDKIIGLATKIV